MSDDTLMHYGLDRTEVRALLDEVADELRSAGGETERDFASVFEYYRFVLNSPESAMTIESTMEYLGTATNQPEYFTFQARLVRENPNTVFYSKLPDKSYEWGKRFLLQYMKEIRSFVCTEDSTYRELRKQYGSYPQAFVVAVSTALVSVLGLSGPLALGIATLILLVLAQATMSTFCKMTDEEVLKEINDQVEQDNSELRERIRESQTRTEKPDS